MSVTFTKLFSSITESTVWCEPDGTRLAWICMLAMADRRGRVYASIPGLASRARITVESAEKAIETFMSPDKYSRTPEHEGRRIEPIDGGWRLLNHQKYRDIRDEEAIKESKRNYINTRRAKEKSVEPDNLQSNAVERGRHNAEAEAEAETKREKPDRSLVLQAKIKMQAAGVKGAFDLKSLATALDNGCSIEDLVSAAEKAAAQGAKPAYAIATAVGRLQDRARTPAVPVVAADPDSRSSVEAEAFLKGIASWDGISEQWHIYRERVRNAQLLDNNAAHMRAASSTLKRA